MITTTMSEVSAEFRDEDGDVDESGEEQTFRIEDGGVLVGMLSEEEADGGSERAPEERNGVEQVARGKVDGQRS